MLVAIANACQLAAFTQVGPTISAVGAVPDARAGVRADRLLHLPARRVLRRARGRGHRRRLRRAHRAARRRAVRRARRRAPRALGQPVHEARHLARRRGAARRAGGAAAHRRRPRTRPRAPGAQPRRELRPAAGALRRRTSRCSAGEVLALLGTNGAGKSTLAARGQRPRAPRPRRRAHERAHDHAHRSRDPGGDGHDPGARRRGAVPEPDGRGEPQGVEPAHRGPGPARASASSRARDVPRGAGAAEVPRRVAVRR